ncbi:MAG: hypothetical protein K2J54_04900 [Clostridia bacterium]|nr:hypothetical protein [Clostridia bacterium]
MNFFHYIYNDEIKERAFAYLLSLCDGAEMLYACDNDDEDALEFTALGTEYEVLIPAIVGAQKGESWGMWGRIYKFALTDGFKSFIVREGLEAMPQIVKGVRLENLALFNGGKVMYSTCSHEPYNDIDEEFKQKVSDYCKREIVKTKLYSETLERYKKLPHRTRNERAVIQSKLQDLNAQVESEWEKVIRGVPHWNDLTYKEYLTLAKPVLSSDVYEQLERAGSYKGLHSAGYPRTLNEISVFRGVPEFSSSELLSKINAQIDMLKTVFYIEEGLDDWHIDGEGERTPSIIINQIKED